MTIKEVIHKDDEAPVPIKVEEGVVGIPTRESAENPEAGAGTNVPSNANGITTTTGTISNPQHTTVATNAEPEEAALPLRSMSIHDGDSLAVRKWKSSPFAVGLVPPTWQEESNQDIDNDDDSLNRINNNGLFHLRISGLVCGSFLKQERLGHMTILWKTYDNADSTTSATDTNAMTTNNTNNNRPRIVLMAGPFWFVTVFVTIPVITIISFVIFFRYIVHCYPIWVSVIWAICLATCLLSLVKASTMDPGIQYRYNEPPQDGWIWNDQAKTYRAPSARYVTSCAVVVDGYDHVCPWVGTAIGAKNMKWFRRFVWMVGVCLLLDVALIMMYAHGGVSTVTVGCKA